MDRPHLLRDIFGSAGDGYEPLLNNDELQLASLVYKVAFEELKNAGDDDNESVLSFDEKIEATKSNLKQVTDIFEKARKARKQFLRSFPSWSEWRLKNIKQLRSIATTIQTDRFNGNISKLVGGCVGVVGGAAVIASLLFPPAALVTVPLTIAGGVASGLGGATIFGTSITELVLLQNRMEEGKDILEQDKICFKRMEHWFEHTKELVQAVEDIVGFDLMKSMSDDVKKFLDDVKNIRNFKSGEYNKKFKMVLDTCVKKMCSDGMIQLKFGVQLAPVVMTFIFVVCLMCQRNRFVFDCVIMTHRLGLGLLSGFDVGVEAGRVVAGVVMRGGAAAGEVVPRAVGRAVALGVFAAVGIALDVANIVLTAIDVHKGSLSKHGLKMAEVADKLEEEFQFFEKVYYEIKDGN